MSDNIQLDLREQIIRIDRMREEGLKFSAEQRKLSAEAEKLALETRALRIMRWVTPVAATIGAGAASIAALPILRQLIHG